MVNLDTQIERTGKILNDIKSALKEQGVSVNNLTPEKYADAVRSITNNITIENVSMLPVLIFKRSELRPNTPTGGQWNIETDDVIIPNGWYSDSEYDNESSTITSPVWMSVGIFKSPQGDMYKTWSTPVRISGINGKDGKQGEQGLPGSVAGITVYRTKNLYYGTKSSEIPNTPQCTISDPEDDSTFEITSNNWSTEVTSDNPDMIWWMSIATYNTSSTIVACTTPIRISAESSVVSGIKRKYLLNNTSDAPRIENSLWKDWNENETIVPTKDNNYLWCYDITSYSSSNQTTSPVYLLAKYSKGLLDIDVAYTCGVSIDDIKNSDNWFVDSSEAIIPNDEKNYEGLSENTIYLWCRETFKYVDGESEPHYRIISYYKAAEKAAIIYSAGTFNYKIVYTRTDEQRPYVYYPEGLVLNTEGNTSSEGKKYNYFVLKKSYPDIYEIPNDDNFASMFEQGYWEKIDSFEAIYSDIGILKAAEVGNFVFDDKYMFSKFGVDNAGKESHYTEYSDWDKNSTVKEYEWNGSSKSESETKRKGIAAAIEHGAFVPSMSINAVTGESWFANGNAHFEPNGNWKLGNDTQYIKQSNNEIIISKVNLSSDSIWKLNSDGSGQLANGNIIWNKNGGIGIGASAPTSGITIGSNVTIKGRLDGCTGSFKGNLDAAGGSFKGELSAATGSFAGSLSAVSGSFTKLTAGDNEFITIDNTGFRSSSGVHIGKGCGEIALQVSANCPSFNTGYKPAFYCSNTAGGGTLSAVFDGKIECRSTGTDTPINVAHVSSFATTTRTSYPVMVFGEIYWKSVTTYTTCDLPAHPFKGMVCFVQNSNDSDAKIKLQGNYDISGGTKSGTKYYREFNPGITALFVFSGSKWEVLAWKTDK